MKAKLKGYYYGTDLHRYSFEFEYPNAISAYEAYAAIGQHLYMMLERGIIRDYQIEVVRN